MIGLTILGVCTLIAGVGYAFKLRSNYIKNILVKSKNLDLEEEKKRINEEIDIKSEQEISGETSEQINFLSKKKEQEIKELREELKKVEEKIKFFENAIPGSLKELNDNMDMYIAEPKEVKYSIIKEYIDIDGTDSKLPIYYIVKNITLEDTTKQFILRKYNEGHSYVKKRTSKEESDDKKYIDIDFSQINFNDIINKRIQEENASLYKRNDEEYIIETLEKKRNEMIDMERIRLIDGEGYKQKNRIRN